MSVVDLFNPSRAFLAVSAVLTGYCLLRFYAFTTGNQLVVPYLLASGALLAMADGGWRLLFSRAADPELDSDAEGSGLFSTTASYFIACFTTLAGLMCAMTGGYNSFLAAVAITIVVLVRSALFRNTEIISPFLTGAVQGLLVVLGMTAHPTLVEMLLMSEARIPVAFFAVYIVIAAVLSQVRDTAKPRSSPIEEELTSETASRLLEIRDNAVDRSAVWFAGVALILLPLGMAWVMPWRWLSWTILVFLSLSIATKLIPVVVYRTRKDLDRFVEAVYRGAVLLNAGGVASMGDYRLREIYNGWIIPTPGRDELAAVAVIIILSIPAWLLQRAAPVDR